MHCTLAEALSRSRRLEEAARVYEAAIPLEGGLLWICAAFLCNQAYHMNVVRRGLLLAAQMALVTKNQISVDGSSSRADSPDALNALRPSESVR